MKIIHKDYCSRCKTGSADIKNNKSKPTKKGVVTQYYFCRKCTRERFKKYYHNNKDRVRGIIYRSIEKHFAKQEARIEVNKAVKSGKLTKPTVCPLCKQSNSRIEGHHTDYTKPLDVVWLCTECHADADKSK